MTEQRITITIDENGKVVAKTAGFQGDVCMEELQDILGGDELFSKVKPKDEFYNTIKNTAGQKQKLEGRK